MPAKNPRLTITLKPSTAALMRRMSELTGNSQSALIGELLEANEPVFERLVLLLQAAHDAKAAVSEETKAGLEAAQAKLEKQLGLALDTMDEATQPLLAHMESLQRRAAGAGGGGPRRAGDTAPARAAGRRPTPMSNRGVRSSTPKTKVNKKGGR